LFSGEGQAPDPSLCATNPYYLKFFWGGSEPPPQTTPPVPLTLTTRNDCRNNLGPEFGGVPEIVSTIASAVVE